MMRKVFTLSMLVLLSAAGVTIEAAGGHQVVVVTASNTTNNQLLVYDIAGTLIESLSTLGDGGVGQNAGGIATNNDLIAVVNFGSQSVSVFSHRDGSIELSQVIPSVSQPVSVAFGNDHLYVLGTTTLESHRIGLTGVENTSDATVALLLADGSAAQVGVVGNQLIASEKSGAVEVVQLRDGAVFGTPVSVPLPSDVRDTPFGLVTRGSNAYVTIAHSDVIDLIKNGQITAAAATGTNFPNGPGQQAPCWVALLGPYLFTSNSPSHTLSRLLAGGGRVVLDVPIAAQTAGAPTDITVDADRLAVVESNGGSTSHLTQFRIDDDGNLVQAATSPIGSAANGVAIVSW
jgi:hypothetical protein